MSRSQSRLPNCRIFLAILTLFCSAAHAAALPDALKTSHFAALLAVDASGERLLSLRPDQPLIPASTLKLLTALAALDRWGPAHRFATDFYVGPNRRLIVRGHGDPFLISEEIGRIAEEIAARIDGPLPGIDLDTSAFGDDIRVDGQSASNNPYDAPPGAIAANFNTVFVGKAHGRVRSMEPQTPLTDVARRLARALPDGGARVNIPDSRAGALNFAQILRQLLRRQGVHVGDSFRFRPVPENARLLYRHRNSHALESVVRAMLKYSTNFIANQLFLIFGADGQPASMARSRRAIRQYVERHFGWRDFEIREGAGLSRQNRLSARQLTELLDRFRPWFGLLPTRPPGMRGKTGTLTGVSCYAGFLDASSANAPTIVLLSNDGAIASGAERARLLTSIRRQLRSAHATAAADPP